MEKGYPVVVKNNNLVVDIAERLETESVPGYGIAHYKEGPWTVQTIGSEAPKPGTMMFVNDYVVSVSQGITVNVTLGSNIYIPSGNIQEQSRLVGLAGVQSLLLNRFFKEKEAITLTFQTTEGGDSNTKVYGSADNKVVSRDFFKAGVPIAVNSDSIMSGTGPSFGHKECIQLLIRYLETNTGYSFRKVLKGKGGWNSSHARDYVDIGGVQYIKSAFGIFVIALGMNDTVTATYSANLSAIIAEVRSAYPNWIIWVMGPTPRQGPLEASALVPIRASAAAIVAALANPKIWYTNLGIAFSSVGDTNYFTNDGTTNTTRLHPNDAGHQAMCNVMVSDLHADDDAKLNMIKQGLRNL
ncbi:MAG: SGNH/GDSL hydrolase family protein [Bacteroidota bacterium]